jgi:hypothetical protein
MEKFRIALIILLVGTAIFGSTMTYCYAKVRDLPKGYPWGMWVSAGRLPDTPSSYTVVPGNVDKWTKAALEDPGKWIYVEDENGCWARGNQGVPVQYNGEFYTLGILFREGPGTGVDIPLEQKVLNYSPIGFTALGALWAVVGVVWYKKEKKL